MGKTWVIIAVLVVAALIAYYYVYQSDDSVYIELPTELTGEVLIPSSEEETIPDLSELGSQESDAIPFPEDEAPASTDENLILSPPVEDFP